MKKTAQKINPTTQKFTEIINVSDDIVILAGNNACSVIEVKATNFSLLSREEQNSKLYAYSTLLNSLSFPIQIVIRSKRLDIGNYLKLLDLKAQGIENEMLLEHIKLYKEFVQELVTESIVLDKRFYITISYSPLEKGVAGTATSAVKGKDNAFAEEAEAALHTKLEMLHSQLARLNLSAKTLTSEELVKLYYDIYNDAPIEQVQVEENVKTAVIKGGQK